ncbi:MAG: hypothetical protein JWN73_714 [Betaproteobacteria bacterium]|nr:hypothetical protein [Betaproteobacteria bacterium]
MNSPEPGRSTASPLRVLIGFSRRSASDDLLRCIEPALAAALGQPVQIDLMPGELGLIAAREAIASAPDGNTILVATFGTHAINPNLRADLGYDPLRDFSPICLAVRSPLVLGTNLSLEAANVMELIALAAKKELTYGSSAVGSAPYLAGLLFQRMAGVKMAHRPYADTRELYEDLQSGRLDLSFNNAASMLPLVRDKQLRALAVTTPQRCSALPGIPTIAEAALEGYALNNWLGLVAPPGTPPPLLARLNSAIITALNSPDSRSFLCANGIDVVGSTPEEFAAYIAAEMKRWAWLRES